jgi:hypothetical protein
MMMTRVDPVVVGVVVTVRTVVVVVKVVVVVVVVDLFRVGNCHLIPMMNMMMLVIIEEVRVASTVIIIK